MKGKIFVVNKRQSNRERLEQDYPGAKVFDVTSDARGIWGQKLSPYYPHGDIPIPFGGGKKAQSVEGIWQGLKYLEHEGISMEHLEKKGERDLKRRGHVLGHQMGTDTEQLLDYYQARFLLYLPAYHWILTNVPDNKKVIERMQDLISQGQDFVLLDYNTNTDIDDVTSPLSHAGLIKLYVEGEEFPLLMSLEEVEYRRQNWVQRIETAIQELRLLLSPQARLFSVEQLDTASLIKLARRNILRIKSQKDMAQLTSLSVDTISKIERGKEVSYGDLLCVLSMLITQFSQ